MAVQQPLIHSTQQRITYRMTDQMGVVYYANYLEFFEIGRTELLRATGMDYRKMEADGFYLPVVHVSCNYKLSAKYDDLITIRAWLTKLTQIRIDFAYEIIREDVSANMKTVESFLCGGVTRHAVIDIHGRPKRLNSFWMEQLSPMVVYHVHETRW